MQKTNEKVEHAKHELLPEQPVDQTELSDADLKQVTGGARPGTQTEDDIYIGIK